MTALMIEMAAVKAAMARRSSGDPWQEGYEPRPSAPSGMRRDAPDFAPGMIPDPADPAPRATLPLNLRRPLGGIANMDRHLLFDDELTMHDETGTMASRMARVARSSWIITSWGKPP